VFVYVLLSYSLYFREKTFILKLEVVEVAIDLLEETLEVFVLVLLCFLYGVLVPYFYSLII